MNPIIKTVYGTLRRFGWAAAVCWIVFACLNGYGGNKCLLDPNEQFVISLLNVIQLRICKFVADVERFHSFESAFVHRLFGAFGLHQNLL